jgi:heme exporter protein C
VPIAIMSFLAFFVVFIASLMYLFKRSPKWDAFAHASAEVGVVFVTLALISGIIWARPVWNTWWTWEPRLTTTLILWLIYVAYLMVRSYAPTQSKGAIYAAVVGIIGFVDVPIVYYSVVWWRSIHPSPVVGPFAKSDSLDSTMALVLLYSFITFVFFFAYMVMERMELRTTEEALGRIRFALRRRGR